MSIYEVVCLHSKCLLCITNASLSACYICLMSLFWCVSVLPLHYLFLSVLEKPEILTVPQPDHTVFHLLAATATSPL